MVPRDGRLEVSVLRLLAEKSTVAIMRELADAPLRPIELRQRLPGVSHSALMRRLAELVKRGAVTHERVTGLSPRAYYSLTTAGRMLLGIPDAAARWERQRSDEQADRDRAAEVSAPRRPPRRRAGGHMTPNPAPGEP
jgi:DNA-binding HxlR family transcriptional regulator